ncbi:MAG TPA: DUF1592 domain-containing protein [Povalibacter sp.]|uniref:DUF1592 domain-containing protein n=1 Tax=Povalibacter sp. TaxID=1962978 RepID=UPI002B94CF56|nr:DUF1592 domain-containing protein [Povalibacter sp.]HMN46762.1 DUF1592 domain-containing protein [Povalibacter sp.]
MSPIDARIAGHAPSLVLPRKRGRGTGALLLALGLLSGCGDSLREPDAVGGPAVMRRLTEAEYRTTIAAIFGPDITIPARFERGLRAEGLVAVGTSEAGMSPFSVEQYDAAALGIAAAVIDEKNRDRLVPCRPAANAAFDAACARRVVDEYGPLLFRRPLTEEESAGFVKRAQSGQERLGDFYAGVELALAGMMVSPEFLLRIERTKPVTDADEPRELDAWSKATRLSYFLTNSAPDRELLRAAGADELDTKKGLQRQVDRLIASPLFEPAVRAFFDDMLQFDKFGDLAKDSVVYPAFNSTVAADAKEQTLRTITDLLIEQEGDYRDLFTTRAAHLTRALGIVYRVPVPTRNGWEKSVFPESSHRAGIQSHVAFLALYSHPGQSSPTLRGKAMRELFLCQEVPDPPPNVNFSVIQEVNAGMPTARDRLEVHRTNPSCAGCHKIMDPLGLTLENYDGLGTYRTTENEARIDPSGSLDGIDFTTPEGLGQALHDHPETPRCLVEKIYRYAVGRDTEMEERPYMDYLNKAFATHDFRVPDLMRTIALSENFFAISPPAAEARHELAQVALQSGDRS